MSDFHGKAVLVTGASSGLGAAVVRRIAAAGGSVYAASRDQERLAEVAASCADLPGEVAVGRDDVVTAQVDGAEPGLVGGEVVGRVEHPARGRTRRG